MSNLFGNLNIPTNVEQDSDFLGGTGALDSDIYPATITHVYSKVAASGARALAFKFELNVGGRNVPYSEDLYVTDKQGNVSFTHNGSTRFLPGYNLINSITKALLGKEITQITSEKRVLPIYNYEMKKEVPTEVDAVTELFGKKVHIALQKVRKNKEVKDANGVYQPTAEERIYNSIDKILFEVDGKIKTFNEATAQADATFAEGWLAKNKGNVRDQYKEVSGTTTTATGAGAAAPVQPLVLG